MGWYEQRFETHGVHDQLERLTAALTSATAIDFTDPTGEGHAHLDAIGALLDYVSAVVSSLDPRLTTLTMLEQVEASLQTVRQHLEQFTGDPSPDTASAVAAAAATVLNGGVLNLPRIQLDQERVVESASNAIRIRAESATREIASASASALTQLDTVSTRTATAEDAVERAVASISATVESATANMSEAVTSNEATLQQAIDGFKATTEQLEAQRTAALSQVNEALAGMERRFSAALERAEDANRSQLDAQADQHRAVATEIAQSLRKSNELLQLAGGEALSGRWIAQAKRQFWERVGWYVAIALILTGSLALAAFHLDELTAPAEMSFVQAVVFYAPRLPFAVITITILGFAVQQAGRRAHWEARDRRVANELTALPAFLETIPDAGRGELAQKVADKYFPGPQMNHDAPAADEGEKGAAGPGKRDASLVGSLVGNVALVVALIYLLAERGS